MRKKLATERVRLIRDLVKLKKIQKSEKNSDWSDITDPPTYYFFLIGNIEKHKKTQHFQKNIRVGTWPTHPLSSFSRIFDFLKLFSTLYGQHSQDEE